MESLLIGARDEKLDIEPISYDLIVDINGRTYTKPLKDYNKDAVTSIIYLYQENNMAGPRMGYGSRF